MFKSFLKQYLKHIFPYWKLNTTVHHYLFISQTLSVYRMVENLTCFFSWLICVSWEWFHFIAVYRMIENLTRFFSSSSVYFSARWLGMIHFVAYPWVCVSGGPLKTWNSSEAVTRGSTNLWFKASCFWGSFSY